MKVGTVLACLLVVTTRLYAASPDQKIEWYDHVLRCDVPIGAWQEHDKQTGDKRWHALCETTGKTLVCPKWSKLQRSPLSPVETSPKWRSYPEAYACHGGWIRP